MLTYKKIFSMTLILAGFLILISEFIYLPIDITWIIGATFILQGLFSVIKSLNNDRRDLLFLFTILFMIGIIFIIKSNFNIRETREIVFTSILLISGGAFLMLFIENSKERIFALVGVIFFIVGYLSINLLRDYGLTKISNSLAKTAEDFWPIVLISSGLILFLNRKK